MNIEPLTPFQVLARKAFAKVKLEDAQKAARGAPDDKAKQSDFEAALREYRTLNRAVKKLDAMCR